MIPSSIAQIMPMSLSPSQAEMTVLKFFIATTSLSGKCPEDHSTERKRSFKSCSENSWMFLYSMVIIIPEIASFPFGELAMTNEEVWVSKRELVMTMGWRG